MLGKFLEASFEWEATQKDHPKSIESMASHNISFVLLIDKDFNSL